MQQYVTAAQPEFSALCLDDGTIYHQRGEYYLVDDSIYLPVNRSYAKVQPGSSVSPDTYKPDKLINDSVQDSDEIRYLERRLAVLGKTLLFLELESEDQVELVVPSKYHDNPLASAASKRILEIVENAAGSNSELQFGIHGSHAVGLNGVDSDMDLIAWTDEETRQKSLKQIDAILSKIGFQDANQTPIFEHYVMRLKNLTKFSRTACEFLASQRNRWISPDGVSTSLQLLDSRYDHSLAKSIIEKSLSGEAEFQERVTTIPVEIESAHSFNYPRIWKAFVGDSECYIISFNMVHQGMGAPTLKNGERSGAQVMTAARFGLEDGTAVYILQEDSDFILPEKIP